MKKLLMFATAMTIVGGAFADIRAYDYKASVKNVNVKTYTTTVAEGKVTFYIKYVESSSLYGYLINACTDCAIDFDQTLPENGQGFLVVANKKTVKKYGPKILPADLIAKWWNPQIKSTKKLQAQGYLFAGNGKKAVPFQDDVADPISYVFGDGTQVAGGATRFLFGDYNDFTAAGIFFDCWLDAAGFGTAVNADDVAGHCGPGTTGCMELDTLSGSVIGGLWLCWLNGNSHSALLLNNPVEYVQDEHLCTGWAGTSDVISGTWSIKRNTKFVASDGYTDADVAKMAALGLTAPVLGYTDMDMYVDAAAKKIVSNFGLIDTSIDDAEYTAAIGLYETKQNGLVNIRFATAAGGLGTGYVAVEN